MVDVVDAARYVIYLSYAKNTSSLTPLKLQKILYLAQGWSYVWDHSEAFDDEFDAWQYGPVNERVYELFKKYGRSEIPKEEGIENIGDDSVADTLDAIWLEYGKMTAYELVEITHMHDPWRNAYSKGIKISNSSIREYFQSTY